MLDRLPTVLTPQEILDKAFARAAKLDIPDPVKYHRIRKTELARLQSATETAAESLSRYPEAFGSLDRMRDYHRDVLDILVGEARLRKALGSVAWSAEQVRKVGQEAEKRILRGRSLDAFFQARKRAYGRISSIVEEVGPDLAVIAETRAKVKVLPNVSPDYATLVIAGYPNVGKTSLLRAWTDSRAEVNEYAFTTKHAEVGHFVIRDAHDVPTMVQVVDTPGLLDRPDADRNEIERQAIAALRHVADAVLFLIDPTETCGYGRDKQEALLVQVRQQMAGLPFLVAESKSDMDSTQGGRVEDGERASDGGTPDEAGSARGDGTQDEDGSAHGDGTRHEVGSANADSTASGSRFPFSTKTGAGLDALHAAILAALPIGKEPELDEDPLARWQRPAAEEW